LYFDLLRSVSPAEILAQRIVWSLVFLLLVIGLMHRWRFLRAALRSGSIWWRLALSALLVGCNWFLYITAVTSNEVIQASLGYFINPLVSVLLGMLFFAERLRPFQWLALSVARLDVVRPH